MGSCYTAQRIYIQSLGIDYDGRQYENENVCIYIYTYDWVTMLYNRNWHNTGNLIKKKTPRSSSLILLVTFISHKILYIYIITNTLFFKMYHNFSSKSPCDFYQQDFLLYKPVRDS